MTDTNDTKMQIWDALKTPPGGAMKKIEGGRMSGSTNINAQWRLEAMTKQFGPVGIGWRYDIKKLWTVPVGEKGEVAAFAEVDVYIKQGEAWSHPIPGIGGNMLVVMEKNGLHVNDECFKMATTDALSVAFKALGVAAEVYLGLFDDNKYGKAGGGQRQRRQPRDEGLGVCPKCGGFLRKVVLKDGSGRWFMGCQGYPDCKFTKWPDKDKKPAPAPAPKAAPPAQRPSQTVLEASPGAAPVDLPGRGAQEVEELCLACGNHPINPDGHCPNEHKADAPPQEQVEPEWRPQHCGRSMMPRPSSGGEAPRWHCPKCRATRAMSEEERGRVGL